MIHDNKRGARGARLETPQSRTRSPMRKLTLSAVFVAAALAWPVTAPAADAQRGGVLYEGRCHGCHDESVHGRQKRAAADFEAVRAWVRRWSEHLGLGWTEGEVSDVTVHLNQRYYHFTCPPADCNALGGIDTGGRRLALDDRSR